MLRLVGTASPQTKRLPTLALGAFDGPASAGFARLGRLAGPLPDLARQVAAAYQQAVSHTSRAPELDLFLLTQAEWRREDGILEVVTSYAEAVTNHLARARLLLADLRAGQPDGFLAGEAGCLQQLAAQAAKPTADLVAWRSLYLQTRLLKRAITFWSRQQKSWVDFGSGSRPKV